MTTDSDRLLAEGSPLILSDGRTVHVRFTMRSLKALEDAFGDFDTVQKTLTSTTGAKVGPMIEVLAAGLIHEGLTADDLYDLTSPGALQSYVAVISDALEQAFPDPTGEVPKVGSADGSRGVTSTTSPPFATAAPTSISGA